ncbi:hypothetical protein CEK25_002614 [Fusarium fujikuroi]|nr:hypothetical protein CEK25_002614 [Fusarium fujikuroi]
MPKSLLYNKYISITFKKYKAIFNTISIINSSSSSLFNSKEDPIDILKDFTKKKKRRSLKVKAQLEAYILNRKQPAINLLEIPIGELKDPGRVPSNFSLESTLTCMAGEEKRRFIHFVKRMITWHPEDRSTAKELLADPWLYIDFPQD